MRQRRYLWLLDPAVFFGIIDPAYAGGALSGVGVGGASKRHKLKAVLKVYRYVEAYPHTPDHNIAFTNAVRTDTSIYNNSGFTNAVRTDTPVFHNVT